MTLNSRANPFGNSNRSFRFAKTPYRTEVEPTVQRDLTPAPAADGGVGNDEDKYTNGKQDPERGLGALEDDPGLTLSSQQPAQHPASELSPGGETTSSIEQHRTDSAECTAEDSSDSAANAQDNSDSESEKPVLGEGKGVVTLPTLGLEEGAKEVIVIGNPVALNQLNTRQRACERLKEAFEMFGKPTLWDGLWCASPRVSKRRKTRYIVYGHPELTKGYSESQRRTVDSVLRILGILPPLLRNKRGRAEEQVESIGLYSHSKRRAVCPPVNLITKPNSSQHLMKPESRSETHAQYSVESEPARDPSTSSPACATINANRYVSYWIGEPVTVPGVGTYVACTVKDGSGRHTVVAYGFDRRGSGHYSYSHTPGMDNLVGPLYGSTRAEVKEWLKLLGVDQMENVGGTLEVDFSKFEPLPKFRRQHREDLARIKLVASAMTELGAHRDSKPEQLMGSSIRAAHNGKEADYSDGEAKGQRAHHDSIQSDYPFKRESAASPPALPTHNYDHLYSFGSANAVQSFLLKQVHEGQAVLDASRDATLRCKQAKDAAEVAYDAAATLHIQLQKNQKALQAELEANI